jgi:hypothetical protein
MDGLNLILKVMPKEKLIGMIKPHVPMLINAMREAVAIMAGATPEQRTGVLFFSAAVGEGKSTTMATVFALDAMDQPGDTIGTIDVVDAFNQLDLATLLSDMDKS